MLIRLIFLSCLFGVVVVPAAHAIQTEIVLLQLDPAELGNRPRAGVFNFGFSDLNGRTLGRELALEIVFANDLRGRVVFPAGLFVGLFVQTTSPMFVESGWGYLRGVDGQPLPVNPQGPPAPGAPPHAMQVGQGLTGNGEFVAGLGFLPREPVTFSGAHFDLVLPPEGTVTAARLQFWTAPPAPNTAGEWFGVQFGTAAQVPEPATWLILSVGLAALVGVSLAGPAASREAG